MTDTKPLLPNNSIFIGYHIDHRVNVDDNIEVYLINDFQFMYLIKNKKRVVSSRYSIKEVFLGKQKFYCFISSEYIEDLQNLWKSLTELKGFALVAGMDKVKHEIYKNVILPILYPEKYEKFHVSIPNGILLYGPTGCGKTFIVEKLAEEINYNFLKIDHSEIASPYIHESVIKISKLFDKAKKMSPCILFLDEIEALMPKRSNMAENLQYKRDETNEFLLQLNNAGKEKILVIGATNSIELIDSAILRSGRFDEKIYVPAPDNEARISLFKLALKDRPVDINIDFNKLSNETEGYSCSDIIHIVDESSRFAIMHEQDKLTTNIILGIIREIPTSIRKEDTHKNKI